MNRPLILVDDGNAARGTATWEEAHAFPAGKLHRAFSTYVFRKAGTEILIQRRSGFKLFAGLWANSCCSHPREGEEIETVAPRRLQEELGFTCALKSVGGFVYQAQDPAGRGAENEHVTVFRGDIDDDVTVTADPHEVDEWKWMEVKDLQADMKKRPASYAPWFHRGLPLAI
ncbi:isopentenyl-diphosphate Delta-isomerase [Candidatus Peribacteria bacterium]|nr:isopentenyl-diphosphate Delta-isomerase [Candidatus Peribacteria bacterium]